MTRAADRDRFPGGHAVTIDLAHLRARFRALRRQRGISQGAVARLLDVCQSTISGFEQGRHRTLRNATLVALHDLVARWESESNRRPAAGTPLRSVLCSQAPTAQCPACGLRLPLMDQPVRFCCSCGRYLGMYCRCGALIADGLASFCGRCGKRLDPSAAVHPGEHDFEAQCAATLRAAGVLDILELMANATKRAKPPR